MFFQRHKVWFFYCIKAKDTLGEAEEGETGPGQMFAPFLAMEDLLDKLKLLNYEKELVLKMRMRPINRQSRWLLSPTPHIIHHSFSFRHYFMIPTNSGEQFFLFTSLSAWLIRTAGTKFDPPQVYGFQQFNTETLVSGV